MKSPDKQKNLLYLLQALAILTGVVAVGYGSFLNYISILIISMCTIAITPSIIKAWIKQKQSQNRFTVLCNYLTNIIPIFLQKTKIRYTLGELLSITDGQMNEVIKEAVNYIDTKKDDPELLKNALKIIENRFPNSRVKSIHKFLLSVENTNSKSYKDVAENLYNDVENWIKRTYSFQKDIKNRQSKIIILCALTLVMNVIFVYIYVTNEYFMGFVENIYYQISTTIFLLLVLAIIGLVSLRLNGEWLIDDMKTKDEEYLKNKYRLYKQGKQKIGIIDILLTTIFVGVGIYFFYKHNNLYSFLFIGLGFVFLSQKQRSYSKVKRLIRKEIVIEFPIWLREVSLSLGNLTVLNAIDNSIQTVSYPLRREIRNFLATASKNPTSIKPYNDFLDEYKIDDVKSSMRVLYAVNNVSKEDMKMRTAKLIDRNQELLAKSEQLRNNDSIGNIEMIGYLPTVIFSIQMMASMLIMFNYMLDKLGGSLKF